MDLVFAPSQVESWPIARLRPYARNAKMHGDDQVAKIAASMAKFGWTVPCMVADDGELIAGHGRVLAATMLGLTEVPVIRLSHLDEAERRAYRIADNKLTELGEWDEALLRDEIAGLLADDFDLTLLGISDEDLDALLRDPEALGGDGPVEGEDNVPELPVTPVSVPGDLWQLGSHRLICGDSTSADVRSATAGSRTTAPKQFQSSSSSRRSHSRRSASLQKSLIERVIAGRATCCWSANTCRLPSAPCSKPSRRDQQQAAARLPSFPKVQPVGEARSTSTFTRRNRSTRSRGVI